MNRVGHIQATAIATHQVQFVAVVGALVTTHVLTNQLNGLHIPQAVLCGALNELAGVLLEPRFLAAERPLSKPSDCQKDKGHQRKQTDSGRRWF